ncbi:Hypothetical predicted protein [Xyrichtys novacula]|uniref:Uncharacterized protein n=1 Tax=Xyrichtys novacula TaxID=13765 RepID=A0AAV1F062_XYRNO|nr:Hypothetical predicted protein [Xyrichtys novacula]
MLDLDFTKIWRSHTPASIPAPHESQRLLIGPPLCPSAYATPDWLVFPPLVVPRGLNQQFGPIACQHV